MKKTIEVSSYEKNAIDFLKSTNTEFKAEFLKYGLHFDDDKDERAIYKITLSRGSRSYSFNFGQSINSSYPFKWLTGYGQRAIVSNPLADERTLRLKHVLQNCDFRRNKDYKTPTAYDVLACVQKYEVGTFENFCGEFGYDVDSRKAEKTYKAVCDEYNNISHLFNESELEQLQEIN